MKKTITCLTSIFLFLMPKVAEAKGTYILSIHRVNAYWKKAFSNTRAIKEKRVDPSSAAIESSAKPTLDYVTNDTSGFVGNLPDFWLKKTAEEAAQYSEAWFFLD